MSDTPANHARRNGGRGGVLVVSVLTIVCLLGAAAPAAASPGLSSPLLSAAVLSQAGKRGERRAPAGAASRPNEPASPAGNARAAPAGGEASDGSAERSQASSKGLLGGLVEFIVSHKYWIVAVLVAGILGSMAFLFISGRREQGVEEETVELIPLHVGGRDDDEGPRRVLVDPATGRPRDMPERDESEYALVVDEEELHLPHEGTSSGEYEKAVLKVQELIEQKRFDEAYRKYLSRIESHSLRAFHPALERRLGKYFLRKKEYDKAARILEHHVNTQPANEIEPETYFDLGYIHFKEKTLERSRHFFGLFADRERDPAHRDRARRLLESLERVRDLN